MKRARHLTGHRELMATYWRKFVASAKSAPTERLSNFDGRSRRSSRMGWGVLYLVLLSGPVVVGTVTGAVYSILSFPATGDISLGPNIFNVQSAQLVLIFAIAVIGLNIILQSGVVSLGQSAPFLIGAYAVAIFVTKVGLSFLVALLLAGIIAGAANYVLGLPALRLGSVTFVMVTMGYALVLVDLAFQWGPLTGGGEGISGITLPTFLGNGNNMYWLIAVVTIVCLIFQGRFIRSRLGRQGRAVEGNRIAATALGIQFNRVVSRSFVAGGIMAGLAGGLYAGLFSFVSPSAFGVNIAILFLLMVVFGGRGSIVGPLIGAFVLVNLPQIVQDYTGSRPGTTDLVYGIVLLLCVLIIPGGIAGLISATGRQVRRRRSAAFDSVNAAADATTNNDPIAIGYSQRERAAADFVVSEVGAAGSVRESGLVVDSIGLEIGGMRILQNVSLTVDRAQVHGLIGPNGAGKTSLLNIISGFTEASRGDIRAAGTPITGEGALTRADRGIARTFQHPSVFDDMTILENIICALDHGRGDAAWGYAFGTRRSRRIERSVAAEAERIWRLVGSGVSSAAPAGSLPPGRKRFVEIARAYALRPQWVLLDEPAAGLIPEEVDELVRWIERFRGAGTGVLLIEHNMGLVMSVSDVVTVLDSGQIIAQDIPAVIKKSDRVLRAYVGTKDDRTRAGTGRASLTGASDT